MPELQWATSHVIIEMLVQPGGGNQGDLFRGGVEALFSIYVDKGESLVLVGIWSRDDNALSSSRTGSVLIWRGSASMASTLRLRLIKYPALCLFMRSSVIRMLLSIVPFSNFYCESPLIYFLNLFSGIDIRFMPAFT